MHTDLPKTINDAIKILAYNEYFWAKSTHQNSKVHISPHPKDIDTVRSLAESQYAWTEKQAKLAVVILKRYLTKFQAYNMDIKALLENPEYESPFRVINFEKSIEKWLDDEEYKIEINFPYNKKLVTLIKLLKDQRGLPLGYAKYDGESKKWTFKQTDVTTYFLTLIAIRYDFKFIDESLLDDFDKVKAEIEGWKKPTARLDNNNIVIDNASESLVEYWKNNISNKRNPLQQLDALKEFGINSKGLKLPSYSVLGGKIAHLNEQKAWVDKNSYSRDELLLGLAELDCFPIIMPVSGDPHTEDDAQEWYQWLQVFQRHGIENTNIAFGFDVKEPKRKNEDYEYTDNIVGKMSDDKFEILYETYQLSKQFKYVDKHTKIIFCRNRIPKTLIRSGIKPRCTLVAMGGGYYTAGTENLKRYLDSLPKTLYYNDNQPSNWDWRDRIIIKL